MIRICDNFFIDATNLFIAVTKNFIESMNFYISSLSTMDFVRATNLLFQCKEF